VFAEKSLQRLQQQKMERERAERVRERFHSMKVKESERVAEGKNPFYLKRSAKKQVRVCVRAFVFLV
jgi:NADH:ubiquinone oxidoreductase subunit E